MPFIAKKRNQKYCQMPCTGEDGYRKPFKAVKQEPEPYKPTTASPLPRKINKYINLRTRN